MTVVKTSGHDRDDALAKPSTSACSEAASMRRNELLEYAAIVVITFAVYAQALTNGYVWNDSDYVTKDSLRTLSGLRRIWFEIGATEQYYPALHSAFWFEHRLWGDAAVGYHIVNVFWHAIAACLLVAILRRLAIPGAFFAGLLFAVHPVAVESVAWISEQKNTLSAVFGLTAVLVYLHFDSERRTRSYLAALGCFVLALLSKTVTATIGPAILVVLWWKRGRLNLKRDVLPLGPWLAAGAIAGLFSSWVERHYLGAQGIDFVLSPLERIFVAGRAIWFYFGKALWPVDLMFVYPRWTIDASLWWQCLFPITAIVTTVALWCGRGRFRGAFAIALLFVGTLFPTLGFLNVYAFIFSFVADHWQYLALPIIVTATAVLWAKWSHLPHSPADPTGARRKRQSSYIAAGVALFSLAALSARQCRMYRDAETLYRVNLGANPQSWLAHNNLGVILANRGDTEDAISHYRVALALHPTAPEVHNNIANALAKSSESYEAAAVEYETAIRFKPDFAEAHNNLSALLLKITGRELDAILHAETAVQLKPQLAASHYNLANALRIIPSRVDEAIAEYRIALALDANLRGCENNLGTALLDLKGDAISALSHLRSAVRLDANSPITHFNLGRCLASIDGQADAAITEFEAALKLSPQNADAAHLAGMLLLDRPGRSSDALDYLRRAAATAADDARIHADLGLALLRTGAAPTEARTQFEIALHLSPDLADAHYNLANLMINEAGEIKDAIGHYEKAIAIAPDFAEAHFNLAVALIRDNREKDAIGELQKTLRLRPDISAAKQLLTELDKR